MIRGYPASAGVAPGGSLVLHIATDARRFRVVFYRWGEDLLRVSETDWLRGEYAPPRSAAEDWQWPSYEFPLPQDWPSAVYIAHLEEPNGNAVSLAMESAAVLFVVRGSAFPSRHSASIEPR